VLATWALSSVFLVASFRVRAGFGVDPPAPFGSLLAITLAFILLTFTIFRRTFRRINSRPKMAACEIQPSSFLRESEWLKCTYTFYAMTIGYWKVQSPVSSNPKKKEKQKHHRTSGIGSWEIKSLLPKASSVFQEIWRAELKNSWMPRDILRTH